MLPWLFSMGGTQMSLRSIPIAIDLTLIYETRFNGYPSGIQRIELAYAEHILSVYEESFALVRFRTGYRVLFRKEALGLLDLMKSIWNETRSHTEDRVYQRIAECLTKGKSLEWVREESPECSLIRRPKTKRQRYTEFCIGLYEDVMYRFKTSSLSVLPKGTVYVNVSYYRHEEVLRLGHIKPIYFVHDLIPIINPEYFFGGDYLRLCNRLREYSRSARHLFVSTQVVKGELEAYYGRYGMRCPSITAQPFGAGRSYLSVLEKLCVTRPYFIMCSTIEPRKNHLQILQVWRQLIHEMGEEAPLLLVVGQRGSRTATIRVMLDRCRALRPYVLEVNTLSTPGLAHVLSGATASLMPSYSEGFSLPVLEALISGVPALISDIDVHRELFSPQATLISPLDWLAWKSAIKTLTQSWDPTQVRFRSSLVSEQKFRWECHFAEFDRALKLV